MNQHKHTSGLGQWTLHESTDAQRANPAYPNEPFFIIRSDNGPFGDGWEVCYLCRGENADPPDEIDQMADEFVQGCANFIIEARAVAHETGRTPRQLADERAALMEALRRMLMLVGCDGVRHAACRAWGSDFYDRAVGDARRTLARCTADTPEPVAASDITATDRADLAAFVSWADGEIGAGRHLGDDPSDSEPVQQIERGHEIARRIAEGGTT